MLFCNKTQETLSFELDGDRLQYSVPGGAFVEIDGRYERVILTKRPALAAALKQVAASEIPKGAIVVKPRVGKAPVAVDPDIEHVAGEGPSIVSDAEPVSQPLVRKK